MKIKRRDFLAWMRKIKVGVEMEEKIGQNKEPDLNENSEATCEEIIPEIKEDVVEIEEEHSQSVEECCCGEDCECECKESNDEKEEVQIAKSPEILALEEEKKNLIDRLSRLQADFDNYRRRALQENKDLRARANEKLLSELLSIIDNFERALDVQENETESFIKGIEMIYRQIMSLLEKEGVTPIEADGESFDPNLHHGVIKEPAPEGVEEDTVTAVLQKGYMYKDRVLRPAMVKVAE